MSATEQSIEKKFEDAFSTAKYVVDLDDAAKLAFKHMREAEESLLYACDSVREIKHKDEGKRVRFLGTWDLARGLPPADLLHRIQETKAAFKKEIERLAKEQKKAATVGASSAKMPTWITGEPLSAEPSFLPTKVTYRFSYAHRGGQLTPAEGIEFMKDRLKKAHTRVKKTVVSYEKVKSTQRAELVDAAEDHFSNVNLGLDISRLAMLHHPESQIIFRATSGVSTKFTAARHIKGEREARDFTFLRFALVPFDSSNDQHVVIEEAKNRERKKKYETLFRNTKSGVAIFKKVIEDGVHYQLEDRGEQRAKAIAEAVEELTVDEELSSNEFVSIDNLSVEKYRYILVAPNGGEEVLISKDRGPFKPVIYDENIEATVAIFSHMNVHYKLSGRDIFRDLAVKEMEDFGVAVGDSVIFLSDEAIKNWTIFD